MEQTKRGLAPVSDGWFVVNARDGAWLCNEQWGDACVFESDAVQFRQIGYDLHILQPGQPNGLYHREEDQEDFLVHTRSEVALRHGAGVETETPSPTEAYRQHPRWRSGRPASFEGTPFA